MPLGGQQALHDRVAGPTVTPVIQDAAELRARGQVYRRVDELDVDVDTWRAGMRRMAQNEGMRIRTFLVLADDDGSEEKSDSGSDLVFAVQTNFPPPTAAELAAILDSLPAPAGCQPPGQPSTSLASVTSLTDQRSRRSGHPCTARDEL